MTKFWRMMKMLFPLLFVLISNVRTVSASENTSPDIHTNEFEKHFALEGRDIVP